MRRPGSAGLVWSVYGAAGALLAMLALLRWSGALLSGGPVLYGEGAVAHAAALTRTLDTYRDAGGASFTAANYPPLYFIAAAFGDPFVAGRLVSIAATLAVAGSIAWRGWIGGRRDRQVAAVIAVGWLALAPVSIWGPALKPDLVALALTVGAVLSLERGRARLSAGLIMLAILAKPTAVIVAVALLVWLLIADRVLLRRWSIAMAVAAAAAVLGLAPFGYGGFLLHVVVWNALSWSAEQAALLLFLGLLFFAALIGGAVVTRASRGPIAAYLAAGVMIAILGGREGATINYLLDLSAAASLALVTVVPSIRHRPHYPAAALVNLIVAALVVDPLGVIPGRTATTGAWGDPARVAAVRTALAADRSVLAEDSGLLVATGHELVVDDLFLWSRLAARGAIDPVPLLESVRAARFTAILSEVDLARLSDAPGYERARWDPALVQAVELRYRLVSRLAGGVFVYRPR